MIQQKLTKTKTKMILITKTLVIFPLLSSSTSSSSSSSLLVLTSVSVYSVMCTAPLYPLQEALYKYCIITVARGRYSDRETVIFWSCYYFLWSPYVIGRQYIFSCCGYYLWPPYVIGGPLYFCPVVSFFFFFLLLLFFPRLISAAVDWMFTILWHMVWP